MLNWETLENRTLLSATTAGGPINTAIYPSGTWVFDMSATPEGPVVISNPDGTLSFDEPTLSSKGRLQIFGSPKPDQISVEQVTGIDSTSSLPAIVFRPIDDGSTHSADSLGTMTQLFYADGQTIISDIEASKDVPRTAPGDGINPAIEEISDPTERQKAEQDAKDLIAFVQAYTATIGTAEQEIAYLQTQTFTHIRVAGMYDVYVDTGDTPITIAIDSGAGNDSISVAPNVNDKTSILGGKGNDMLISGKMHTYLAGGAGNDVLVSRSKHGGTLDGGPGDDTFDSRFSSTLVADATSSDFVDVHGQSYPMATAAASSNVSMKNTTFSEIFVTPDGLV